VLQFQEKVEDGGLENTENLEFFHVHIFLENRKIEYTRTY